MFVFYVVSSVEEFDFQMTFVFPLVLLEFNVFSMDVRNDVCSMGSLGLLVALG